MAPAAWDVPWGSLVCHGNSTDTRIILSARASHRRKAARSFPTSTRRDSSEPVRRQGFAIGRATDCDYYVGDKAISRYHCLLFPVYKAQGVTVFIHNQSPNGTFVNDTKLGFNELHELKDDDDIILTEHYSFTFSNWDTGIAESDSGFHGRYTVLDRLGGGSKGKVLVCTDKSAAKNTFAVKHVVRQSNTLSLCNVAKILMTVDHPNIIHVKELIITGGDQNEYLVTEYAPEGNLSDHIVKHKRLPESVCRKVFVQLFKAIKYLHDHNIAHLNIKLESIWVFDTELNLVKLSRFDLSTLVRQRYPKTRLCGTPYFMAPEVLTEEKSRKYGSMSDIWSLGVVLYICLCGFPPFSDELFSKEFPYSLSEQIKSGRFDYPSPHWDSVGDPALDLIDSMLVVNPKKRLTAKQCLSHPWITQTPPSDSGSATVSPITSNLLDSTKRRTHSLHSLSTEPPDEGLLDYIWAQYTQDDHQVGTPQESETDTLSDQLDIEKHRVEHHLSSDESGTSKTDDEYADLRDDLRLEKFHGDPTCWTCTPSGLNGPKNVPLTIDGYPVVIPVQSTTSLMTIPSPPPDPRPTIVSTVRPVPDKVVQQMFDTFPEAKGFYVLINGDLQVIMPKNFDLEEALFTLPVRFGGLRVSFIAESLFPTAGESVAGGSPSPTTTFPIRARPSETPSPLSRNHTVPTVSTAASLQANWPPPAVPNLPAGTVFSAIIPRSKSKARFEGKVGVMVREKLSASSRTYVTVPTHVLTNAIAASKAATLQSPTWMNEVGLRVTSTGAELGKVARVFDPQPGTFPLGFAHDLSLVDVTWLASLPTPSLASAELAWLPPQDWSSIKYNTTRLVLLDDQSKEAKTIGVVDSMYQAVGQGIFRTHKQARSRLSSIFGPADPRDDPGIWTGLVARSVLYRLRMDYDHPTRGGQSGTPVCIAEDEPRGPEDGGGSNSRGTGLLKVAGFASFVQMVSDVQKYDNEGDKLYKRLQEGRVAFYGAFQVPKVVTEGYNIVQSRDRPHHHRSNSRYS